MYQVIAKYQHQDTLKIKKFVFSVCSISDFFGRTAKLDEALELAGFKKLFQLVV